MTGSRSPLALFVDLFRSPSAAFIALYQHGKWGWWCYLLLLLAPFLFWGAYFDMVNFDWLVSELTPQIESINPEQLALLDANTLMASEILSDVTARSLTICALAFWFYLATKAIQPNLGYWKWVAACCAILFPAILGDIASYVSLSLNQGYVLTYAADLNSLNGLAKLPLTNKWSGLLSAVPLLLPWYIVLGFAVTSTWTNVSRRQAIKISSLPWLIFYLVWFICVLIGF